MFPGGVILAIILMGLAVCAVIGVIIYRKMEARKKGLQKF
ncbi:hypothetical protein TBLA_0A01370 [Henningerozyma blattae CBS 6284]|uniref:Uncharacterized protein n=1 Tax=Henningerozyma blattae (strain ATCC 34711 / CBS 6284 / DSM 70876 / NBRC 10599 / NRRL Y-10934 / UCD 77-7) TaxID=1071380 RepID=I2GUY4_HENB6|nr:hypothetical protein TBLA_0A01370 [Tetrapisispora blattae CBS 6284]CCH57936.1 hypothetical protein TBLA_0A01370 [Tetrapisispora blattae CBS 6284]